VPRRSLLSVPDLSYLGVARRPIRVRLYLSQWDESQESQLTEHKYLHLIVNNIHPSNANLKSKRPAHFHRGLPSRPAGDGSVSRNANTRPVGDGSMSRDATTPLLAAHRSAVPRWHTRCEPGGSRLGTPPFPRIRGRSQHGSQTQARWFGS